VTLGKRYPNLSEFPFAIQKIIAAEENKVNLRQSQHLLVPIRETGTDGFIQCNCQFSRRYQFPCQHIFHIDRVAEDSEKVLTSSLWRRYLDRFGKGGMELYEKELPRVLHLLEAPGVDPLRGHRVLRMKEINECIQSTFYHLEEMNPDQAAQFIAGVEEHLTRLHLSEP
jgi:hypothetical protein